MNYIHCRQCRRAAPAFASIDTGEGYAYLCSDECAQAFVKTDYFAPPLPLWVWLALLGAFAVILAASLWYAAP